MKSVLSCFVLEYLIMLFLLSWLRFRVIGCLMFFVVCTMRVGNMMRYTCLKYSSICLFISECLFSCVMYSLRVSFTVILCLVKFYLVFLGLDFNNGMFVFSDMNICINLSAVLVFWHMHAYRHAFELSMLVFGSSSNPVCFICVSITEELFDESLDMSVQVYVKSTYLCLFHMYIHLCLNLDLILYVELFTLSFFFY